MQHTYDTLVTFRKDSVTDVVGLLAQDWTVSDDGKTYTFTLRKDAKFQCGHPVKASDVAYSFARGMIQDRASGPQWILLQPFFGLDVQRFYDQNVTPGDQEGDDVVNAQFNGDLVAACNALQQRAVADDAAGTVTMKLAQPYGPFLTTLTGSWGSIIEKAAVAQLGGWDGTCADAQKFHDPAAEKSVLFEQVVGSGPYRLERWDHGNEISLVANDQYWLTAALWDGAPSGAPKIKRILVKNVPEWGTRYSMLVAGDADIVAVPRANISQLDPLVRETCDAMGKCTATNPQGFLRLYKDLPTVNMDAIFFNWNVNTTGGNNALGTGRLDGNGIPPNFFGNVHIRKAFNYCFDWQTFIKQYWQGEATQALGPILPGYLGYDPNQAHYTFDLNMCREEFTAASRDPGFEGLMDKGFFAQYAYNTGNTARQTAGQILKDNLAKVNSKFRLGIADELWPVFLRDQNQSRLPVYMVGWHEDFHDPHNWVHPFLASGGTFSRTQGWSKDLYAQLDSRISRAVSSTAKNTRSQAYAQLQDLAYQNALSIYLTRPLGRHYQQMWIKGLYYNPAYSNGFSYYALSKGQ